AVADLVCGLPLMKVSDRLTDIAELIVEQALQLAWSQMSERYGVPQRAAGRGAAQMIVVAYGKLGGLELGYGSDLDLVFLHDADEGSGADGGHTDGLQQIDNTVFFQRLGQRLVHLLTVLTSSGRLLVLDTRLRPGGDRDNLVWSHSAFHHPDVADVLTWKPLE